MSPPTIPNNEVVQAGTTATATIVPAQVNLAAHIGERFAFGVSAYANVSEQSTQATNSYDVTVANPQLSANPSNNGGNVVTILPYLTPAQVLAGPYNGTAVHAFPGGPASQSNESTTMNATFTPNYGLTLQQAAQDLGYTKFNWQQTITSWPSPSNLTTHEMPTVPLAVPPKVPFLDPVPGGYAYMFDGNTTLKPQYSIFDGAFPFYYNPSLVPMMGDKTITFGDQPMDPCILLKCDGSLASGSMGFTTALVGVLPNGKPSDPLVSWTWSSDYTCNSGDPLDCNSCYHPATRTGQTIPLHRDCGFPESSDFPSASASSH
ncbi:MAG: hypothetical protein E6K66_03260 [Nitrospirae bacterium]|nr:MAG: hypothetical protein E6K66_03260 [Nitrospirota bacterium]